MTNQNTREWWFIFGAWDACSTKAGTSCFFGRPWKHGKCVHLSWENVRVCVWRMQHKVRRRTMIRYASCGVQHVDSPLFLHNNYRTSAQQRSVTQCASLPFFSAAQKRRTALLCFPFWSFLLAVPCTVFPLQRASHKTTAHTARFVFKCLVNRGSFLCLLSSAFAS